MGLCRHQGDDLLPEWCSSLGRSSVYQKVDTTAQFGEIEKPSRQKDSICLTQAGYFVKFRVKLLWRVVQNPLFSRASNRCVWKFLKPTPLDSRSLMFQY